MQPNRTTDDIAMQCGNELAYCEGEWDRIGDKELRTLEQAFIWFMRPID